MSAYSFRTITIDSDVPVRESTASGAVTPGQLIEQNAATTYRRHAGAGAVAATIFAVEDDLQGKEIGEDYSTGSKLFFKNFRRGDKVFAMLENGQNVAVNAFLVSNGNGNLKEDSSPVGAPVVARALEAIDLSDSQDVDARILIEIM